MFWATPIQFNMLALIWQIREFATPHFWLQLYHRGQFGDAGEENLPILILVRLLVIILIFFAARILVGLISRLLLKAISTTVNHSHHSNRRLSTLRGLLISTISYLIFFIAIVLVLFTMGATWAGLAPLLGAASVLGLAIGFGAQRLVRDIITGLFILGEGQFDVGDWVTIGVVTGRVEDIGLRITRLRDELGRQYVIANGDITQVFNASRGAVKLTIDIVLLRDGTVDGQIAELHNIMAQLPEIQQLPSSVKPEPAGIIITAMDTAKVSLRLLVWVSSSQKELVENALRQQLLQETARENSLLKLA